MSAPRQAVLELTTYEDRIATFEDAQAAMFTSGRTGIVVRMDYDDWHRMGRPTQIAVTLTVEPVR